MVTETTTPTPAAGYLRRSSLKQERSIEDQRADIERYAAEHGYRIIVWFVDDGISGDATGRRVGFRRMHKAACNGGGFKAILCWDQDRFGRFDSVESGYWIHPLRQAGVKLVTVTDGPIDWSDFTGRVMYSLKQESKHQFLVDLARRVARGQRENAAAGGWNGGPIPYAFERGEFTSDGRLVRRLRHGENARKGFAIKLAPTEDPEKLAAVRFAFERVATAELSIRELAREMDGKGYPSPTGAGWRHDALGKMLRNPVYCGHLRWAADHPGKYAPVEETITQDGAFGAIVTTTLFARVQARLAKVGRKRHARRAEYPLRGLIFCKHCGRAMQGETACRGSRIYQRYLCSTYSERRQDSPCAHFTVPADRVLAWLVHALQRLMLGPARGELIDTLERQLEAESEKAPEAAQEAQRRLAELDARITRLRRAIGQVDDEGLVQQLREAKHQRERVEIEASQAGQVADPHAEAERLADQASELAERLGDADPAVLRDVIGLLVSRIACQWETHRTESGRRRSTLVEGRVELRDNPLTRTLSGGVDSAGAWEPGTSASSQCTPPRFGIKLQLATPSVTPARPGAKSPCGILRHQL